jgi:YD repeat-containing protein
VCDPSYSTAAMARVLTERTTQTIDGQPVSKLTTHVYDADGQLLRTSYPDGSESSKTYDANGNVLTETDALNRTTTHSYDPQNRKTQTRHPDQSVESWTYDAEGRELTHTDVLGRTTKKVYDAVGRLIETIHPDSTPATDTDNPRTKSVYDAAGRMTQSIDELGRTTTYEYDAAGSFAGHAQRDRRHAGEGKHARAMCRRHREGWMADGGDRRAEPADRDHLRRGGAADVQHGCAGADHEVRLRPGGPSDRDDPPGQHTGDRRGQPADAGAVRRGGPEGGGDRRGESDGGLWP